MGERLNEFDIFDDVDAPVREPEAPPPEWRAPDRKGKRELDQFYTRPEIARRCMTLVAAAVSKHVDGVIGTWLEPSAGMGAFLDLMPTPRLGLDLDPAHEEVVPEDFLLWKGGTRLPGPVVTVGNPPFGKNASLALRFVNHAASFSSLVCMILPRTFEKASMQAKVAKTHHLVETHTLDPDSFSFDGANYSVPCCFQIWKRMPLDNLRTVNRAVLKHCHFRFVENQGMTASDADAMGVHFAFQRVGGKAGLASVEGLTKSWKSHYWIIADENHVDPEELMRRLNDIDWSEHKHRTAGNPSIGKGELILEYTNRHGSCVPPPPPGTFDFR